MMEALMTDTNRILTVELRNTRKKIQERRNEETMLK
jgi:hypothetical protein